ncbi:MAG: type II toxin-antitoxin system HicA family toxin [Dehalococcoidia bacterium]|nr:type II toxin-antitoxin system HicA family toxin [Dehalococcoidia bacterium]
MRPLSGPEFIRIFERMGFVRARRRRNYIIPKRQTREGEVGCVVPLHRELATGTLKGILKQA